MAKVTSAYVTYDSTTNRESLSNTIYDISPFDVPIMSAIGKNNVSNRTFDWSTDSLPAVSTSSEIEGFELTRSTVAPQTRQTNVTQINKRDATISGSQEAANVAGMASPMALNMAKAAKALKRDMETILSGKQARVDGDDSTPTARKTRALEHWIQTNKSVASGYSFTNATTALTDGTTARAFTETQLKDVLQACYTSGAEPSLLVVGPYNKRVVSGFAGRTGTMVNVSLERVQASVSLYASDFGDLKVIPSRFSRDRTALLLDPSYAKVSYYRPFKTIDIATIGDAQSKMIVAEWGLEVGNEAAHGKVADLTVS